MRSLPPVALLALIACACAGAAPAQRSSDPDPASSGPGASTPAEGALAEGTVALASGCAEGSEERCDALDSDCDGLVDEGCEGALTGPIVVAVAWNTPALVRLDVRGPVGPSASGEPACDDPRRAYQSFTESPEGEYVVTLVREAGCGQDEGVASVTVSVGGRALGPFNRALPAAGARAEVVRFSL